jgi:hypothetical protein
MVYLIFAMTLYLLPPRLHSEGSTPPRTTENSTQRAYEVGQLRALDATAPERSACCASFS